MKSDLIWLVYVDDTILSGPNLENVNKEIRGLGVSTKNQIHSFQLRDKGLVGDFLGIRNEKIEDRKFNLT